jgi:hypothetical protein
VKGVVNIITSLKYDDFEMEEAENILLYRKITNEKSKIIRLLASMLGNILKLPSAPRRDLEDSFFLYQYSIV